MTGSRFRDNLVLSKSTHSMHPNNHYLGILSFDTAKTMSHLLSIYKSLSDREFNNLKHEILNSEGVKYLNSSDESFLLTLACAERLEDLDKIATAVTQLCHKCPEFGLKRFHLLYSDLKSGTYGTKRAEYGSRNIEKLVKKFERLIFATTNLYSSMETLTELEITEQNLQHWRKNGAIKKNCKMNIDILDQKISNQRKQVRYYLEISLWSQIIDKIVSQMSRIICVVYARICKLFGTYFKDGPAASKHKGHFNSAQQKVVKVHPEFSFAQSNKATSKPVLVPFLGPKFAHFVVSDRDVKWASKNYKVSQWAGPATVGGCGLTLRYTNLILLAEKYLDSGTIIGRDEREILYEMLPENLRTLVRSKLRKNVTGRNSHDELLATGWREALESLMGWLGPMAHHTMRWQSERNYEKNKIELKPTLLLVQTLYFSDREKTEAAIAEVLVGLSCIYRYKNHGMNNLVAK